jgi:hypothetical protein
MQGKHIFEDAGLLGCDAVSGSSTNPTVEGSGLAYNVAVTPTFFYDGVWGSRDIAPLINTGCR